MSIYIYTYIYTCVYIYLLHIHIGPLLISVSGSGLTREWSGEKRAEVPKSAPCDIARSPRVLLPQLAQAVRNARKAGWPKNVRPQLFPKVAYSALKVAHDFRPLASWGVWPGCSTRLHIFWRFTPDVRGAV